MRMVGVPGKRSAFADHARISDGANGGSLHHRRLRDVVQTRDRRDAAKGSDSLDIIRTAPCRVDVRTTAASRARPVARLDADHHTPLARPRIR